MSYERERVRTGESHGIIDLVDDDVRRHGAAAAERHYQERFAKVDDGEHLKAALSYLRYQYGDEL